MSGRSTKWVLLVVLPLLLALYASYPPAGVLAEKKLVEKKVARTAEEAEAHGVQIGQHYEVSTDVTWKRFLPLAPREREEVRRLVERKEDGTIVEEVTTIVQGRVKLGLDVAGGTELLYQLSPEEGERLGGALGNTIDILKKRIDPSNVKEYRIQALESRRILIQVPHATASEVEQLKSRLEKMGKLEFRLAVPLPQHTEESKFLRLYEEAEQGRVPEDFTTMHVEGDPTQDYYLVKKGEPPVTGRDLDPGSLRRTTDRNGFPAVGFEFNPMGVRTFAQVTERNRGWALAIVLDGVLKSAPLIKGRIYGPGIIEGRFSEEEVADMVNVLRAGSLPMDITLLQESTVGPQLGRDSIHKGLVALAVAGLLVLAFIGIYYLRCGMVADGALILNLVLLLGVLCILGAALTLPGMAGVLLTVGMAVDANVLIFERIREESAAGKGIRVALRNGYDRAFTTIVDANVTTLLTAVILYLVGTGPVRGFAVTLSFGILLSMFTALVVTRLAFETMIDKEWMKEFKMFALLGRPNINFSGIRKPAYVISAAVVAVGVVAFFARGSDLYDIDFTGGSLVQVSLAQPTPVGEVRALLESRGFADAEVQAIQTAAATAEGTTDFGIRIKGIGIDTRAIRRRAETSLIQAGLMREGDSLEVTPDESALRLEVAEPIKEMDLRAALGEGGDPYAVPDIATITPDEKSLARKLAVRVHGVSSLASRRDLWARMLRALGWAGLAREDYTIRECAFGDAAADGSSLAQLSLELDKPLQPEILAVELDRKQFPGIEVTSTGPNGSAFVLTAEREELERFQREFPAGVVLQSVPVAKIDGLTVEAGLANESSEQDIRAHFEQQGLTDVDIVPVDVASSEFYLNFGYEPIRETMQSVFAGLARRGLGVSFEPVGDQADEGEARVKMTLDEPMSFADVRRHIEVADVGPYADQIVAGREDYAPDTLVADLTLRLPADKAGEIQSRLQQSFGEPRPVQKIVRIGSTVAEEMQGRALLAVVFASVIIVLYVAVRFHAFRFGVAAVIALVHDLLITAGLVALADWSGVMGDVKIGLASLAAFLTILGYSLNDTIVVFDRIRENMVNMGRKTISPELINTSINQTLSRTVLTSMTTLAVVIVLYLLGGPVLHGLALTLIIGVIVGTYSSMFIASPVLLDWAKLTTGTRRALRVVFLPVTLPFKLVGMLLGAGR
ncbi:MAG: protein translocase subunit SecD [Planctomycetota bacterium]|jgi:protein-export membrane protein SecD/preprotein translocase SecF subunit